MYDIIVSECQRSGVEKKIDKYFESHGTLTVSEAKSLGISRAMLSYMVRNGRLSRLAQGLYAPINEIPDDLVVIARRSERIVFSHETALALHRLHNRIPALPTFTVPTGCRSPRSLDNAVVVYHIRKQLFELGRTVVSSFMGNDIPCYDPERTICDVIRSRSRMEVETYTGAIRTYAASSSRNLPLLFYYAKEMGIERKAHAVMEVLA
jgi:predicted transcriptional regulator of viral defense system